MVSSIIKKFRPLFCVVLCMFLWLLPLHTNANQQNAILLDINGPIGPATQDYFHRGLQAAENRQAQFVILRIDTPGGLDKSMRGIIKDIIASPIPIITYVAPEGARAASAGTYILFASHIAAMAPATNVGSATPVSLNKLFSGSNNTSEQKQSSTTEADTEQQKIINDELAFIRGLAQLHGRNVEWAEKAIIESANISATEALNQNVINIIAINIPDLLKQLNNHSVIIKGEKIILHTEGIQLIQIQPDWITHFLTIITDPSVAYILLIIGIYGLFFEFMNPGFVLPGVVGGICLLLALYAFQLLPISYAGLSLILLGIIFMIAEAFMPTFGALGIGGIIAFTIGSILLLGTQGEFGIPWNLIITMAIINILFIFVIVGLALKSILKKKVSGKEALIGSIAIVREDFIEKGWVRVESENWQATTVVPLEKGQRVRIKEVDGLNLIVEPEINHFPSPRRGEGE